MAELEFDQFNQQLTQYFADENYSDGLAYAEKHYQDYPDQQAQINYLRICFAAKLKDFGLANNILETTLANGIWYSEMILRKSPSLQGLQEQEDFEDLVEVSLQMEETDPSKNLPVLVIRPEGACEPGSEGCPTMVFLHGNSDNVKANLPQWATLPKLGWLLAMPQSSRAMWADAYAWLDYETGGKEVVDGYEKMSEQYAIDPEKTILAGFSMGGEIALALALEGKVPAKGFILIGPGGPYMDDLDKWTRFIELAKEKNLRGVVFVGEADNTISQNNIRILVDRFNQSNIQCKLKTYPGLKHEYPPDFQQALADAIAFILE